MIAKNLLFPECGLPFLAQTSDVDRRSSVVDFLKLMRASFLLSFFLFWVFFLFSIYLSFVLLSFYPSLSSDGETAPGSAMNSSKDGSAEDK